MTPARAEAFCARTDLLLRMLDGDLSRYCGDHVKGEIRRILHYAEPPLEPTTDALADADE